MTAWQPGWYGYDPADDEALAWGPHETQREASVHPANGVSATFVANTFLVLSPEMVSTLRAGYSTGMGGPAHRELHALLSGMTR